MSSNVVGLASSFGGFCQAIGRTEGLYITKQMNVKTGKAASRLYSWLDRYSTIPLAK